MHQSSATPPKYVIPEGAVDFEDKVVDDTVAEDETLADDKSFVYDANDSVLIAVGTQGDKNSTEISRVAEEDGNKYLHYYS